ncbi:MAG TPA: shikimate kinase [Chitinophagaceae bacterium]
MKIYLIGFMSSGKSHWGKLLSRKLDIPFFDLDDQVVSSEGKSINDIFIENGEEYFRQKEKEILHIISESHDTFIMATGGGTPCYYNNIDYMNQAGLTVWISTPVDTLFKRLVKEKEHRPLIKNLTDVQLKNYIIKKFSDRKIFYEQAAVIIEEEDITEDAFVSQIFHE